MDKEELEGCAGGCSSCAGCSHDDFELPEDLSPIITLTSDTGEDVKFEILDVVVLEDEKQYLIVTPVKDEEDSDGVEVVILEIKEEDGEEVYDTVVDEELGKKVFDEFIANQQATDDEE